MPATSTLSENSYSAVVCWGLPAEWLSPILPFMRSLRTALLKHALATSCEFNCDRLFSASPDLCVDFTEDFALPAATASFSLRFTAPLLAAEHFRLLTLRCETACHRRLRRHRLWRPSALNSRRSFLLNHILTFG